MASLNIARQHREPAGFAPSEAGMLITGMTETTFINICFHHLHMDHTHVHAAGDMVHLAFLVCLQTCPTQGELKHFIR